MSVEFTATARRLGFWSAIGVVGLSVAYVVTLAIGLMSTPSTEEPVTGPLFTLLEIQILVIVPVIVTLMVAVHAWAPPERKVLSLTALVFTTLFAGLTFSVHFVILTVGSQSAFSGWQLVLSFRWPSLAYALDILAWDVFFGLATLFVAPVFGGSRLAAWIRGAFLASGVLALAGLSGVIVGDMRLRSVGIAGYAVAFPVAALLVSIMFKRAAPARQRGVDA